MTDWTPVPTTHPQWVPFYHQYEWVTVATQMVSLAFPIVFLFTGFAPRLRAWSARLARNNGYLTVTVFGAAYLALATIVVLPVMYLAQLTFFRAWHVPTPSDAQWLAGRGATLVAQIVIAAASAWIPYTFMRRKPRVWWLYTAAVLVPMIAIALVIYQRVLMPLWTSYRPLPSGPLVTQLQGLAERCGVKHLKVLVGGNDEATVIGLGPFNQIVVSEGFLRDLTEPEQAVALAHELKHYITADSWEGVGVVAVFLLVGLRLVDLIGRHVLVRFGSRWGFTDLADPASLPLVVGSLSIFWFAVGLPVFNVTQTHAEFQADRWALELTHLNRAQGLLQSRNAQYTLNEYDWFYRLWMANHPSPAERVQFANRYRPWENGGSFVDSGLCRMP